jgi:cellulose synthase/poly-beta-1,6-N-acetylglucosamine synthase-like glycosyltransferase
VVADNCSDDTAALARAAGAQVLQRHDDSKKAKGYALEHAFNHFFAAAKKPDAVVVVDADTVVSPETLRAAVQALDAGASGGGGSVRFDGPLPWYARPGAAMTLGVLRLFGWAAGCFVFCTRRTFEAVGGFDERLYAAEEIAFSLAVRRAGRMVLVGPPVTTSARKFRTHSPREMIRMTMAALHLGRRMRSREHLHLWYGDRRRDPGAGS